MVGLFPSAPSGPAARRRPSTPRCTGWSSTTHVDHLHPDSVIALACAADGEKLVEKIWGGAVAWVPWKRPGWELGRTMRELSAKDGRHRGGPRRPRADRVGLHQRRGGGAEPADHPRGGRPTSTTHSVAEPFGPVDVARQRRWPPRSGDAAPPNSSRTCAAVASPDSRQLGHFTDSEAVLDFLSRAKTPHLVHLGTSCPDHFLRTKVRPLLLDTAPDAPLDEVVGRLRELARGVPRGVPRLLRPARHSGVARHARRRPCRRPGARRRHVLVRRRQADGTGGRRVLRQRHQRDARCGGRVDVPAGRRGREVQRRVLGSSRRRSSSAARRPRRWPAGSRWSPAAASGIGLATVKLLAQHGANVVVADIDRPKVRRRRHRPRRAGPGGRRGRGRHRRGRGRRRDRRRRCWPSAASTCSSTTPASPGPARSATRRSRTGTCSTGSCRAARSCSPRPPRPVLRAQGMGGDIINICSKNAVFAGPDNIAYSSAKAAQAHMVRLAGRRARRHRRPGQRHQPRRHRARLRASSPAAGARPGPRPTGWPRRTSASSTRSAPCSRRRCCPSTSRPAVVALTNGSLPITTGLVVPVDSGVPAAFLR